MKFFAEIMALLLMQISLTICVEIGDSCEIDRKDGRCMLLEDCKEASDARRFHGITPTYCSRKQRIICCRINEVRDATQPLNKVSAKKCREYSRQVYSETGVQCAHATRELIIGGHEAKLREFPHMALIGYRGSTSDFEFLCGGSLISPNFVLSAAHCSYSSHLKNATRVKLGDVERGESNPNTYIIGIKTRIKHPDYNSTSIDHDIMLFELNRNAVLNEFVVPICLPYIDEKTYDAIATGWGSTGYGEPLTDKLMTVQLKIFKEQECQAKYESDVKDVKVRNGITYDSKICAGSYTLEKDTCGGDSGGPLQIFNKDTKENFCMYTIIGITSYGTAKCGTIGVPGIYTRVYKYLDWIEKIVWNDTQDDRLFFQ